MKKALLKNSYFLSIGIFFALISLFIFNQKNKNTILEKTTLTIKATEEDSALQLAATEALGKREGTIIVLDPQTGRIRALVNKDVAFEKAFSPGSTIKPFTALTALRSGLIKEDSSLVCRSPYKHDGFQIGCVHGKDEPPFDLVRAIAHSCNYYFGRLGEKINQNNFNTTLSTFGFGERTGVEENEAVGLLPKNRWKSRIAIGETDELLVSPVQLIRAYSALISGARNKSVPPAVAGGYVISEPPVTANIDILSNHRKLLIDGMRGAVEYGTAAKAELTELPLNIFGKTGTATGTDNYRMQGWFVGFAADIETKERIPNPDEIKLAVLVFIKGAHGVDSAAVSKQVFKTFAMQQQVPSFNDNEQQATNNGGRSTDNSLTVKINQHNSVREIALEDYVLGVVATESSFENEPEALKAQAIATRTYALRHLQRHAKDGYDFCTLTHCMRFDSAFFSSAGEKIKRAVGETKGRVLRDANGDLIEAYFGASCGGMTANLDDLWGVASKPYLKTFRDDYCAERPNKDWNAKISTDKLLRAFQSDERTNVGNRLNQIQIIKRDFSGRAEMILLSGDREKQVRGWDFKIIVGRVLGWNLLKSSRFNLRRVGRDYMFVGSGFGHGLGLCQEGAHVMAERGFSYNQILMRYFPTTSINTL